MLGILVMISQQFKQIALLYVIFTLSLLCTCIKERKFIVLK